MSSSQHCVVEFHTFPCLWDLLSQLTTSHTACQKQRPILCLSFLNTALESLVSQITSSPQIFLCEPWRPKCWHRLNSTLWSSQVYFMHDWCCNKLLTLYHTIISSIISNQLDILHSSKHYHFQRNFSITSTDLHTKVLIRLVITFTLSFSLQFST